MKPLERVKSIKNSKPFKIGDIIVVVLVLVILGLTVWTAMRPRGTYAEVYEEGRLIYTLSLDENREVSVGGEEHFVITVKDGAVFVSHSDCPEQYCVYAGAISSAGSMIACVPNKIVIRITGEGAVKGITS
ncbi:MAG: NusG domain II-containing protein [Clostridiaceae bacterium]|jgi:hypothetical protein|nr:NusG domain II-containing protein [Clostridiaceae bacterium]